MEWVTRFFTTTLWGSPEYKGAAAASGTDLLYWSTALSTPITDVDHAQIAIQSVTGYKPNVLVIGPYVYSALKNHASILDRIKYTQRGIVTKELLAALFDVDKVLVAEGVKNAAAKGASEDTDFIAGKHALLAYAAPSPGIKQPTAGYTFAWTGLLGAGAMGTRMVTIEMPWLGIGTRRVEGSMSFDMKLVSNDLGTFFKDIVE